jgi:hypothetical protein
MPEFAATTPSRPFPATAVDIAFGSPLAMIFAVAANLPVLSQGPAPENTVKMFIT